jgi:hypothetical protein
VEPTPAATMTPSRERVTAAEVADRPRIDMPPP